MTMLGLVAGILLAPVVAYVIAARKRSDKPDSIGDSFDTENE